MKKSFNYVCGLRCIFVGQSQCSLGIHVEVQFELGLETAVSRDVSSLLVPPLLVKAFRVLFFQAVRSFQRFLSKG